MKKGDVIAIAAQPIAKGIDWALNTDLSNCSGCKTMRTDLNNGKNLGDAIFDRFWPKQKEEQYAIRGNETNSSRS
jgi:hypothetical protein